MSYDSIVYHNMHWRGHPVPSIRPGPASGPGAPTASRPRADAVLGTIISTTIIIGSSIIIITMIIIIIIIISSSSSIHMYYDCVLFGTWGITEDGHIWSAGTRATFGLRDGRIFRLRRVGDMGDHMVRLWAAGGWSARGGGVEVC